MAAAVKQAPPTQVAVKGQPAAPKVRSPMPANPSPAPGKVTATPIPGPHPYQQPRRLSPPSTQTRVVIHQGMSSQGGGDVIGAFLFGLIVLNGFTSGQFKEIGPILNGGPPSVTNKGTATIIHSFYVLGGEIIFAIALVMIASTSDGARSVIGMLVFALWALWGIQNASHITSFVKKTK